MKDKQTTTFSAEKTLLDKMNRLRVKLPYKPSISALIREAVEEFVNKRADLLPEE